MATDKKSLLEKRTAIKKTKPTFVVKESKFSSGVKKRWRYPRGKHSSTRQCHKGRPAMPSTGYGSPKDVRGLHVSGLEPVVVACVKDLEKIDSATQGAILSRQVGGRKRALLLAKAQEMKITLLNVSDVAKALTELEENLAARKKAKQDKVSARTKKKESKKKAAEKKEKETKETKETKESENNAESAHEHDQKEQEQRKMVEKTITKKQ